LLKILIKHCINSLGCPLTFTSSVKDGITLILCSVIVKSISFKNLFVSFIKSNLIAWELPFINLSKSSITPDKYSVLLVIELHVLKNESSVSVSISFCSSKIETDVDITERGCLH